MSDSWAIEAEPRRDCSVGVSPPSNPLSPDGLRKWLTAITVTPSSCTTSVLRRVMAMSMSLRSSLVARPLTKMLM